MATPFLSEVRIMSFGFAPKGWAQCNGQLMPINQNQALFSLLGTTYGGDGRVNFGLPNMRGSVPIHEGSGFALGQAGGEEVHTVTMAEMPQHIHQVNASSTDGNANTPTNNLLAREVGNVYRPASGGVAAINPVMISSTGGSQAHENRQPYLVLNFCIALQGIFPSQN